MTDETPGGVAAVVVHWRDVADTLGCIESLAADPLDVIVVDNGSREPVEAALAGRPLTCLRTRENLGYAGGANVGIRAALARGAEVVLLLNNDVRVRPGAVAAAVSALAGDTRIGVVGAKVLAREDPSRLWLAWGDVTWRQSLVALRGAGRRDDGTFDVERDVDWVGGCAMWFRRSALEGVGLLDEAFFAYHEEVDWCARARGAGWRVVYCPRAVVTHTGRGTRGDEAAVRIRKYFAARNTVLFAQRHGRPMDRVRLACWLAASLPLELLWHAPRGRAGEVLLKMRGVRDALAERRPPFEALGLR